MAVYMHIGTKEAGETINDLIQRVRGRAKNEQNPAVQLYYFFPYIQYIWFGVKFFIISKPTSLNQKEACGGLSAVAHSYCAGCDSC